jgi:leader peptidase (prepilin peptidase)/N-methyltransferase
VLLNLVHFPRFYRTNNSLRRRRFIWLLTKFWGVTLFWGIFLASLFVGINIFITPDFIVWAKIFSVIICLCIIVDYKYLLLPDFFTIPLLLLGWCASIYAGIVSVEYSLAGAVFGYLVPTIAVFFMGLFRTPEFGCGDVKMVTALGAWLGIPGLNFCLILSFLIFALMATLSSRRWGPFGPALGFAALLTLFVVFGK